MFPNSAISKMNGELDWMLVNFTENSFQYRVINKVNYGVNLDLLLEKSIKIPKIP